MIAIADVCSGNLRSVERALTKVGAEVVVTRDADVVRRADKVIVPGQGAFGVFMQALSDARGMGDALREVIARGTPYLGICLGMQVLFESSEESLVPGTTTEGLGLLRGRVVRLAPTERTLKVPHIGWNRVAQRQRDPLLADAEDGAYFYFVHSFHALPSDESVLAATTDHGGRVTAAVRKDNVFACQFHPEKSQAVGLSLLSAFVRA
ncbi:MAG TPA: imidazole glycerol phosphate synthase subunit HisH [Kofleriaceae bacterium]